MSQEFKDGQKCFVRVSDKTTFVGHIQGEYFIMDDKISNGVSWYALTHSAPDYNPVKAVRGERTQS
jgi:hypothetical protein